LLATNIRKKSWTALNNAQFVNFFGIFTVFARNYSQAFLPSVVTALQMINQQKIDGRVIRHLKPVNWLGLIFSPARKAEQLSEPCACNIAAESASLIDVSDEQAVLQLFHFLPQRSCQAGEELAEEPNESRETGFFGHV
jgi:hypothetical protein